jgi:hypothetical protein
MAESEPQAPPIRKDGLQLDEKRGFQEGFWTAERWAWLVFALIILVSLAGFAGAGGYFSRATASPGAAEIDYPRISRWESADEFTITLRDERETHRIELRHPFSEYFQIEDVQPQAERLFLGGDTEIMEFAAEPGRPARVTIHVRAVRPGFARYGLSVDGASTDTTTLVLP